MDRLSDIENLLKEKNYKLTFSRREILKCFLVEENHMRAEDIYFIVKKEGISLPTVYRNIEVLKDNNIISEISINGDRFFELKAFSKKRVHFHFKCKNCKKIIEYYDIDLVVNLIDIKNEIEKRYNNNVDNIDIVFEGTCEDCGEN
ncbi:MAG: transcriptional repressor [Clostridiales bacterium]|nr:transcriptional repressor [Clostridiales bacterium]